MNGSGKLVGAGDITAQTRQVFENLQAALASANADFSNVVKITVFMKDVSQLPAFRSVRDEYIKGEPPASSLVQISQLVMPELLIEIDAVAFVAGGDPDGR